MGQEEVSAGSEPEVDRRAEQLTGAAVEAHRLAGETAVDRRSPLLPHTTRLHAGRTRGDPLPLEHERLEAEPAEVPGDRQPDDARADDGHVGPASRHFLPVVQDALRCREGRVRGGYAAVDRALQQDFLDLVLR